MRNEITTTNRTVRVHGNQLPMYLNGRPRPLYTSALRRKEADNR